MGKAASLTAPQRWARGRLLRNAATSYKRLAYQSPPAEAAFWREVALRLLETYEREKLYENPQRQKDAASQRAALRREIGYATLRLQWAGKPTEICVMGYRFRRCVKGQRWERKVRPGAYKVQIKGEKGASQSWTFSLASGQSQAHRLVPKAPPSPPQRRKPSPRPVSIQVLSTPSGAQVWVDGKRRGKTPLSFAATPPQTTIEVSYPCYETQRVTWRAASGQTRLSVMLSPSSKYLTWQRAQSAHQVQLIWGWSVLAFGVAATGFGVVGQAVASDLHGQADGHASSYQSSTAPGEIDRFALLYEQTAGAGNTWRTLGYVGLGTGAVALSVGLWRVLSMPSHSSSPCQP